MEFEILTREEICSHLDYLIHRSKHPITKAVLAPMKAVKKMLVLMEIHLDASIDKLDNLAMDVQLDKEKHMENAKAQKQTEPERAEAERFCVLFYTDLLQYRTLIRCTRDDYCTV